LLTAYAVLVFGFIYLPIVVLIVYSFNRDGVGGFPPPAISLSIGIGDFSLIPPFGTRSSTASSSLRPALRSR